MVVEVVTPDEMPRFEGMPSNLHSSGSETPSPANGKGPVTQAPPPQPQPQQQQLPPDMSTTPIPGPPGPPGPQGPRGSLWYVGSTDPGPGLGTPQNPVQAQDMYLNTTTGDVFQFTSASSTVASRWAKIKQGNKYNVVDERR